MEFDKINELEEKHWWYVGTREICFNIIERFLPGKKNLRMLDIGCGTGGNIGHLSAYGEVEGLDVDDYALGICKSKGLNCSRGDMTSLKLARGQYDLITFFDVLYQAPPERMHGIVSEVKNGLKVGGLMAMREPAMGIASGRHDEEVGTRVRFSKKMMVSLFSEANMKIIYISHINFLLFLPIVMIRKLDFLAGTGPKSDLVEHSGVENRILLSILRLENRILRYARAPFGVSLFVIARKARE